MAPSTRLRTSALALATSLSLLAVASQGVASEKTDKSEALARAKFRSGQRAFDLGQFGAALQAFSEAYELKPLPAFLFNVAQCHRHLGDYERAAFFYKRYLSLSALTARDEKMVRELIAEMESRQAERDQALRREAEAAAEREKEAARLAAAKAEAEAAEKRRAELLAKAQSEEESMRRAQLALEERRRENAEAGAWREQLTHRWWFWAGVGVLAAGTGITLYLATAPHPQATTLATINGR